MNCYTSAILGGGLLAGSAFTLSVSDTLRNKLKEKLSPELDVIYDRINAERRNQYIQGLIIGFILSILFLYYYKISNRFYKIMTSVAISFLFAVFYYTLMPKSDYMLNHFKTEEENKAWLAIYSTMKFRYFTGLLLGAAAIIPLANSMC
jgi:uncharacterized protein YacL